MSKGLQQSSLIQDHIFYYSSDLQDSVVLQASCSVTRNYKAVPEL